MRCTDGAQVQLLDIVQAPLQCAQPVSYQSENHLLDASSPWHRDGRASWTTVYQSEDPHDEAFWRDHGNSTNGLSDRVPELPVSRLDSSLKLIYLRTLNVVVRKERRRFPLPAALKVRAEFEYHSQQYRLAVTDPFWEQHFLVRGEGHYGMGMAMLCVSISELLEHVAYRLVAAIITPKRWER